MSGGAPRPGGHRRAGGQQDPAEADHAAAAVPGQEHVGVGPLPVQGEEVHHPQTVPDVLLAEHLPVHTEDPHVPAGQGVAVDVDNGAVPDIGLHGVPLDAHRELRPPGYVAGDLDVVEVLPEHRGGEARRRRAAVEGDLPDLRGGEVQVRLVGLQGLRHRLEGLPPHGGQPPVPLHQPPLLPGHREARSPVDVLKEDVGLHVQYLDQFLQQLAPYRVLAGFIVADHRGGNAQPPGQFCLGHVQLHPPLPQPLAYAHCPNSSPRS
mgnify:CR=1 FL=1